MTLTHKQEEGLLAAVRGYHMGLPYVCIAGFAGLIYRQSKIFGQNKRKVIYKFSNYNTKNISKRKFI